MWGFFSWKQWVVFSTAWSSTELDWKNQAARKYFGNAAPTWKWQAIEPSEKSPPKIKNNAFAMFGKAVANVDLKVCCSIDVQLHILDSSCIKKKKGLGKLFGQSVCCSVWISWEKCTYQSFLKALWMTLLSSLGQSCCRKKNRWQRLLSIKLPFSFFIFVCTSPCSGEGSCLHMLLLINCIYSDPVDIKAADLLVAESV